MEVRFLGAHACETRATRCLSILVDSVLALDAGGLTSGLTIAEQRRIKAVLLTHRHFDHIRDIPTLAMNLYLQGSRTTVYATSDVCDALAGYLLDGKLYPDFSRRPEPNPTLTYRVIEPLEETSIGGYRVTALAVNHAVPTCGYQVASPGGEALFYSGDTGPGLELCWREVSPQLLITEVTSPNRLRDFALEVGHLTPELLRQELSGFRRLKGYLPRVALVHMNPYLEEEIAGEIAVVRQELDADVFLASEGMLLSWSWGGGG